MKKEIEFLKYLTKLENNAHLKKFVENIENYNKNVCLELIEGSEYEYLITYLSQYSINLSRDFGLYVSSLQKSEESFVSEFYQYYIHKNLFKWKNATRYCLCERDSDCHEDCDNYEKECVLYLFPKSLMSERYNCSVEKKNNYQDFLNSVIERDDVDNFKLWLKVWDDVFNDLKKQYPDLKRSYLKDYDLIISEATPGGRTLSSKILFFLKENFTETDWPFLFNFHIFDHFAGWRTLNINKLIKMGLGKTISNELIKNFLKIFPEQELLEIVEYFKKRLAEAGKEEKADLALEYPELAAQFTKEARSRVLRVN